MIRATVIALDIDTASLGEEAVEAFDRLGDNDALYHVLPSVSAPPDWSRCSESQLDSARLAIGLSHSCIGVVINSAEALCHLDRSAEATRWIQLALEQGKEKTLRILAYFIDSFWGEKGVETLLTRLRQPLTGGCDHLYRPLVVLARSDQLPAVWNVLRLGIQTGSPAIAKGAVEVLSKSKKLKPEAAELDALLDYWTKCGSLCERCAVQFVGNFCPKCHLGVPTPRAGLVRILIDCHHLVVQRGFR